MTNEISSKDYTVDMKLNNSASFILSFFFFFDTVLDLVRQQHQACTVSTLCASTSTDQKTQEKENKVIIQ